MKPKKISNSKMGHEVSDQTKQKLRIANIGNKLSFETRQKMSKSHKGMKHSEEAKQKMCKTKAHIQCPHCNKNGGEPQMKRWHFDNCKERSQ